MSDRPPSDFYGSHMLSSSFVKSFLFHYKIDNYFVKNLANSSLFSVSQSKNIVAPKPAKYSFQQKFKARACSVSILKNPTVSQAE